PGALDVFNIIEKNASQGLHPEIFGYTRGIVHLKHRMLGLKCPANKSRKPAACCLLIAQTLQVFDPVLDRFHVAEHHRCTRFQSELMRNLHHLEPFIAIALKRRNSLPHPIDQNLATPTGDRAEPGLLECRNDFAKRHPEYLGEMLKLRRTKSMNINMRIFS